MKTKFSKYDGFTLVEIMIVVAIIGLLATIAIPNFVKATAKTKQKVCIQNLLQIDGAKQQWAAESRVSPTTVPVLSNIQPYMGRGAQGTAPTCPADPAGKFESSYSINNLDTAPTCLILPGTDGDTDGHRLN